MDVTFPDFNRQDQTLRGLHCRRMAFDELWPVVLQHPGERPGADRGADLRVPVGREPEGRPVITVAVAGPALLLAAMVHRLTERLAGRRADRQLDRRPVHHDHRRTTPGRLGLTPAQLPASHDAVD